MTSADQPAETAADLSELHRCWEESRLKLYAMVRRRLDPALLPRLDADDVLSDAFLDASRRWPQYRPQQWASPYAWLYGVVRDRLIETWRFHARAIRDPRRTLPWPEGSSLQLGLSLVDPGSSPESAAALGERRRRVLAALELLPEVDRELLWMRYFDGLSFAEAAGVLGISENNAHVRHLRALRKFRDLWLTDFGGSRP